MLTVPRIQDSSSSLLYGYYPTNMTGNISDETASNSYCDGLDNVEILIEDFEWDGNDCVKKIKIDNFHSIRKPSFEKEVVKRITPFKIIPFNSYNNVPEVKSTKPEGKKFTVSQKFKKALGGLNAQTSLLGKRKNPFFTEEASVPSSETTSLNPIVFALETKPAEKTIVEEKKMEVEEKSSKPVLIGSAYQAELPCLNRQSQRRAPKPVWNPDSMSEAALKSCFEKMHKAINQNISNHEKAVKLLVSHNLDAEKLLADMKKNKLFYRGHFSFNQRARRDKALQKENYAAESYQY